MPVRYTDEELRGAFEGAMTLGEVMQRLGVAPENRERRTYLRQRMKSTGLDLSRLEDPRVRWTRAELAEAVAASRTMYEVLSRLGIDQVGGWHTHLCRRITKLGIDTSHFVRVRRSAPRQGARRRTSAELSTFEPVRTRRVPVQRLKRALLATGRAEVCADCGIGPEWLGEPLRLEVDHIDGDWRDNRAENLRYLCPNCHSQTVTFAGRVVR
ncbi:HNH endonuclease signature motif containing protein [Streptomyces sp. SPB074]|uniref:HNH endonuclease signature motif containing protein n=1 Tax=Streptomyces sp. (strain SPB074) TaxID=465543 RepID=UPI00017F17A3|nr:HNH endonuclease signature motif containing protein [Streptomyces sp. SPB074]EDY44415.2 HNH endonuclease domain-containing protein [Streptomyces sp. SPB074]